MQVATVQPVVDMMSNLRSLSLPNTMDRYKLSDRHQSVNESSYELFFIRVDPPKQEGDDMKSFVIFNILYGR